MPDLGEDRLEAHPVRRNQNAKKGLALEMSVTATEDALPGLPSVEYPVI